MKNFKPKVIVILGPTSSGKSDMAVEVAKKIKGEIISADSRQVYKGMNIGTGKITKKEMMGVPHYLLDVSSPKKVFTVVEYEKLAKKAIEKILTKNKVPIVCGGTGFYIQSITDNVNIPDVPINTKLRKELSKKTADELFEILKKIDRRRAENIDAKNPVRLIRAIEITKALGKVPAFQKTPTDKYDLLMIGLNPKKEKLEERIKTRLLKRIKMGMVAEIKELHKSGLSWKRLNDLGLEYRYVSKYLKGELDREEMIEKLTKEIFQYAKRQMTWFKRDKRTKWFDPKDKNKIFNEAINFLK